MCLQCLTKSKMIAENVLPGYFLVRPPWDTPTGLKDGTALFGAMTPILSGRGNLKKIPLIICPILK